MRLRRFLPFGPFAPDAPEYDNPTLEEAQNVMPVFGSYRPLPQASQVAQKTTAGSGINGSIAHMVTQGAAKNHARPEPGVSSSTGKWLGVSADGSESTVVGGVIDDSYPNDNDYMTFRVSDNDSESISVTLNDVLDPASATDHIVRSRFKFRGVDDYELEVKLYQDGSPLSTAATWTYDQATYASGVWYERAETLSAAQANAITNDGTNYDNLSLEIKGTVSSVSGGPKFQQGTPDSDDDNGDGWKRSSDDTAEDIYVAIDDGSPIEDGDADYIYTPSLALSESANYVANISDLVDPRGYDATPLVHGNVGVIYRYSTSGAMDLKVDLIEEVDGQDTVRHSRTHSGVNQSTAKSAGFGSHIPLDYVFQDDGGVFTDFSDEAADDTAGDVDLFPATVAVNDAIYFGHDEDFIGALRFDLSAGSGGAAAVTLVWERYNSALPGWQSITPASDGTSGLNQDGVVSFVNAGVNLQQTTVNGVTAYWARCRVSAIPGAPTQAKATQIWADQADVGEESWQSEILNFDKLKLGFTFTAQSASGSDQTTLPNADGATIEWEDEGGNTDDLYESINEAAADDDDYVTSTLTTSNTKYRFTVASQSEPSDHAGTALKVRCRQTGGSKPDLKVRIYYDGTSQFFLKTIKGLTTTWTTRTINLTQSESEALDWGTDFTIEFEKQTTTAAQEIRVSWVQMVSTSSSSQGRIYNAFVEAAESYGVDVSYLEFEVPDTTTYTQPDNIVIYAGNKNSLYKVENTGFTDMSKTSDASYGGGTTEPHAWSACSWGDDCIFTNFVDPVQWFDTSAPGTPPRFVDLITTPASNIPKARFVCTVNNFLVLANITNRSGFGEYSVWWSAIDDPRSFYEGDVTTQSDYQHLRNTPGSVTGVVGGEYGLIFKSHAIYQMVYTGPPYTFAFHLLSGAQGTVYPQSIVEAQSDVYFFGHGGFYRLVGGYQLEPVGDGAISKMFVDSYYESRGFKEFGEESTLSRDCGVVGAYNPAMQMIMWLYRDATATTPLEHDMAVLYNPKEDRWSWVGPDAIIGNVSNWVGASNLMTIPNVVTAEQRLLRTLGTFQWDSANNTVTYRKFTSATTYESRLKSKILSTSYLAGSEDGIGEDFYIRAVKPVFTPQPEATADPDVQITISASDDIRMLSANVNSETVTLSDRNDEGWYILKDRLEGEFVTYDLKIPALTDETVKEVLGIQVDMELGGEV